MNTPGAAEVEKGFVDRQWLYQRRQRLHGGAHLATDPHILRHVGRNRGREGAKRKGFEHRHCRMHAIRPGSIAGGQNHAAPTTAYDYGFVC